MQECEEGERKHHFIIYQLFVICFLVLSSCPVVWLQISVNMFQCVALATIHVCVCVSLTCCKCESCLNLKFSWLQLMKEQRSLELGLSHEYQPKSIMMMGQTNDHNDDDNREYGKFLPLDVLAVGFSF